MRKIIVMPIIAAVFIIMLYPASGFTATEDSPFVTPLIAGGNIPVGEVRVWNDDTNMYVQYVINDSSWCLLETNLAVECSRWLIPQIFFRPIPEKFEFQDEFDCATEHIYTIPLSWSSRTKRVYIAAHAIVGSICGLEDPDLALFAGMLPAEATMTPNDPYLDGPAYLPATDVADEDDLLTGIYDGWCLSTSLGVDEGVQYNANVFSSYDFPDGVVDFPENLDKINWILNQQFVGKPTQCNPDLPVYTYGSVQRAIWSLIDDENSTLSLGPYSLCQIGEILDGAEEYGLFYEPDCKEFVGVVLQPFDVQHRPAQPVIIPVPLPCEPKICCEQTAWGARKHFKKRRFGNNWAMYFKYRIDGDSKPSSKNIVQSQNTVTANEQKKIKNPAGIELE
jgi:hypothetical protein